ncbi:MAG TPA: phospholipase D family protein [Pseudomonadales bacterium]
MTARPGHAPIDGQPDGERLIRALAAFVTLQLLVGCVYVTPTDRGADSFAVSAQSDSRLARMLADFPPAGRAMVINDPALALTSRLDLIDSADHAIDVQYFIWQNDPSGILVIDRLLAAADRGVRVRALVDDVQLKGLVPRLTVINSHPNIEVRIFNPFSVRIGFQEDLFRLAEFAIDGNRLNHRMHNKLLVADNQLAILGGRNIGDDYFGLSTRRNFIDTDLLLSGAVVPSLSSGFDAYWNSRWAVPVEVLLSFSLAPDDLPSLQERIRDRLADYPELTALVEPKRIQTMVADLAAAHALDSAVALVDDPDVSWGKKPEEIADALTELALSAEREVLVVSPYLVLTQRLLDLGTTLHERGVNIQLVTNSLASNDVVIAHAAYARFRQTVLDTGTDLYEFRGDPAMMKDDPAEDFSLHSKYILFDDDRIFVGSLNLDPRSLHLNTELGVLVRSRTLADELRAYFFELIDPDNAWRVLEDADGLVWESSAGRQTHQPAKGPWQRFRSWFLMLLPVTDQL